jgi:enoyl-CoA hydratase/carnithine racemase
MAYKALILEREGPVAIITLNRPEAGNSFDFKMMAEADHVLKHVGADRDVRAVILTGAGKYFTTGIDLAMFTGGGRPGEGQDADPEFLPSEDDETYGRGTAVASVIRIRDMPKPVIAAVNGPAVGLGFALALACDIMIASDRARFSMVFVKRGIVPDTGGSFTLPRIVGLPRACELTLTGDTIDAAEAERIGMVNRVVPHDELMNVARGLATRIAKNPPLAVGMAKAMLYESVAGTDIVEQMKREVALQDRLLKTADFIEAATAFLEKREPVFKGE